MRDEVASMTAIAICLVGIALVLLLSFMRKHSIVFSRESSRYSFVCFVCLSMASLLTNVGVLAHYVVTECFIGGDGKYDFSPDGSYKAEALYLRRFASPATPPYCLLRVRGKGEQDIRRVQIDFPENGTATLETNDPLDFRALEKVIRWSEDSKEVTFFIPDYQVTVLVDGRKTIKKTTQGTADDGKGTGKAPVKAGEE